MNYQQISDYLSRFEEEIMFFSILSLLVLISASNYLFFHTISELFTIVITLCITLISFNTKSYAKSKFFTILSIGLCFASIVLVLHLVTYKGMNIFPNISTNISTQLWIISRYLISSSFLFAIVATEKNIKPKFYAISFFILTMAFLIAIWLNIFPICYIEGQGLTLFKKGSEYLVIGVLIIDFILYYRKKNLFGTETYNWIALSIFFSILSGISFTEYLSVYDFMNLLGHIFNTISFFFVYKALVKHTLILPYTLLFHDLENSQELIKKESNEIKKINKELNDFYSIVAHDLQSPLTTLLGYNQLLKETLAGKLDTSSQKYLATSEAVMNRMSMMIKDLLKYSQLSRKIQNFSVIDITEVVSTVISELQVAIQESNTQIHYTNLPSITGDHNQILALFQNLMENSMKFKKPLIPLQLSITAKKLPTHEWQFAVADNGIGIEASSIGKLFTLFTRLNPRKKSTRNRDRFNFMQKDR